MPIKSYATSGDLARALGVSHTTLRYYILNGQLRPDARTRGGVALFEESTAEAFLKARKGGGR